MNFIHTKSYLALASVLFLGFAAACSDDDDTGGGGSGGEAGAATKGGSAGSAAKGGSPGTGGGGATAKGGSGGTSGGIPGGAGAAPEAGSGGETSEAARVRVLHLSPDAPAVDVFVAGVTQPAIEALEFPKGTPYLEIPAGTYTFDVAPEGAGADASVLTIEDLELAEGGSYTAVAYGELDSISALALADDFDDLPAGAIRVRAVHAAEGVGEVDIWNVTDPEKPAPLYEDVDFGDAGDALDVPAGAYSLGIDTDDDAVPELTFDLPSLPAGTVANVFAVQSEGDVFLLAQLPDGATARIDPRTPSAHLRVLHLSPDAPAVDVFVNGADAAAVSGLEFPEGTPYLSLPAGNYDIDVAAAGSSADDAVLSVDNLALAADTYYTAVAVGELSDIGALPLVDDYAGLDDGSIRVRAIHAAPAVGEVDLWNVPSSGEPAPLWTDVDFGVAGDAKDLPEGAYTVGIDVDDDQTPDLTFALPELEAGSFANVFATNDDDGDVFLLVQLRDGSTLRVDPE